MAKEVIFAVCAIFLGIGSARQGYKSSLVHECLWHNGKCVESCPDGLVAISNNCNNSYWTAQRTCDHPERVYVGTLCGFSRCDCPEPTVLDTDTGYCYDVDNCPPKHNLDTR